jgi:hypothetical protein
MNTNSTPKIRVLRPTNPKKPGTKAWHRFNLYKDGMTTNEALRAGLTREDLRYDIEHGFIEIVTHDNSAPTGNSNRHAALGRIRALLNKTVENGCTEEEAFAAAAKAGELMDRYGIESSEMEIREEVCTVGVHGAERSKAHESRWVAVAIARYCDCRVWHVTGTGQIRFFGLPADVEVATYLMRVVQGAMDRGYREFRKSPGYLGLSGDRNTFMDAMANRVSARLLEMHKARHTETMVTTTGTSLVLVKTAVVTEQWEKTGMRLRKGGTQRVKMSDSHAARSAGMAAGDRVHLGAGLSDRSVKLRIAK